jgi:hypothetical protein
VSFAELADSALATGRTTHAAASSSRTPTRLPPKERPLGVATKVELSLSEGLPERRRRRRSEGG